MAKKKTKKKAINSKTQIDLNTVDPVVSEIFKRQHDIFVEIIRIETEQLNQRIDRLVNAIDTCKRVKGI